MVGSPAWQLSVSDTLQRAIRTEKIGFDGVKGAKNQKTVYAYDDAGRLEEIRYYSVVGYSVPVKTVTFSYDKVGNLTGYDDGTTSAAYTYDTLYRKTGETVNYGSFSLENHYTYYKNGLKETYSGPDAITYGYLYDANNQLAAVQIPDAGYVTVAGYQWNRPESMMLPGGGTREFEYDPMMRIKQITTKDPAANPVLNYSYDYDRMDNITAKATEHGDYAYQYDDLYRLTDVDNPVQADEVFTYDNVGNRLTSADTAGEWTYNENNELTGHDDVTYDYDLNGNMIEKNAGGVVTKFFYNVEDRLERIEDGSGNVIASYYYDPFGRRLWKDVGGTRTCFHYSDEGLVGEYDAAGNGIKTYGWKPGSTWTTDPLFMKIGAEYYYYHNDHLGTPQKITSVSGAVVWSATYSSFGEALVDVGTVTNNLRFPGQYFDAESGLHYNHYRYYEANLGRYLRKDPIGFGSILSNGFLIKHLFSGYKKEYFSTVLDTMNYGGDESINILYKSFQKKLVNVLVDKPLMLNAFVYSNLNPIVYYDSDGLLSMCTAMCNMFWGNLVCTPITVGMSLLGASSGIGAIPSVYLSVKTNLTS